MGQRSNGDGRTCPPDSDTHCAYTEHLRCAGKAKGTYPPATTDFTRYRALLGEKQFDLTVGTNVTIPSPGCSQCKALPFLAQFAPTCFRSCSACSTSKQTFFFSHRRFNQGGLHLVRSILACGESVHAVKATRRARVCCDRRRNVPPQRDACLERGILHAPSPEAWRLSAGNRRCWLRRRSSAR